MNGHIQRVAVAGAGTMGSGIAQVCASAGFETLLFDAQTGRATQAIVSIEKSLTASVEKGRLTGEEKQTILSRLRAVSRQEDLRADLVIEATIELLGVKVELFAALEKINDPTTILATNTSSLSVTGIASKLGDPGRCMGLHFFNPADRMKLVEIISGEATRPQVIDSMREFVLSIGKIPVMAKDSPGFIVNRVARPYYTESLKLLEDGGTDAAGIDGLLRSSGFKMGPFELMDLIGLDTNLAVTTSVYEGFDGAARFKPSATQQQLVKNGHFGRKTGKGFYEYAGK